MAGDTLSQAAIDQLLREVTEGKTPSLQLEAEANANSSPSRSGGTVNGKAKGQHRLSSKQMTNVTSNRRIRDYDFRRPNRIPKEYMRGLRLIHENFSREIPRIWGPLLRAGGQVKIASMEQTIYEEFRNHLSPHCLICTSTMSPLEGEIAFHIELDSAYIIIDRLLGGSGTSLSHSREFTSLELSILLKVMTNMLPLWREAWLPIIHIEPMINKILSSTEFLQLTAPNESVVVTAIQARFLNTDIELNICIPYAVIASIITRVVPSESLPGHFGNDETDRTRLMGHLRGVPVDVSARIGSAPVPVAELTQLRVGDVVRLDIPTSGTAIINVAEKPHFVARPGLSNGSLSVQITDVLRPAELERMAR